MATRNHLDMAERHMVTNVPTALPDETVKDVLNRLIAPKPTYDTTAYIYIVDEQGVLLGAVSLKDAINKPHGRKMKSLMNERLVYVRPFTDQEVVATKAIRNRLKAVPVVDVNKRLLGVVPSRKIFDILHWEHTEDMLRMAGLNAKGSEMRGAIKSGVLKMSMLRLPALIVGLFGGVFATSVVEHFQASLESQIVLAFFIPIILYLSAAVGTQSGTILVRTLATENVKLGKYMLREMIIGFIIALVIGSAMFGVSFLWHGVFEVSVTIGISLFASITTATLLGIFVPYSLFKLKKDPAISGGPLINVIQDIITLTIYFSVAGVILL